MFDGGSDLPLRPVASASAAAHHSGYSGALGAAGDFTPAFSGSGGRGGRVAASIAACPIGVASGNTLVLCAPVAGASSFPGICMAGPDWPCLVLTHLLIIVPSAAFLSLVAPHLSPAVIAVGAGLALATLAALALVAFSDPGYLRRLSAGELADARRAAAEAGRADAVTLCSHCNVLREAGTSHCYECNACVLGLDHHWWVGGRERGGCARGAWAGPLSAWGARARTVSRSPPTPHTRSPWTGKCIGRLNLRYFYAFLTTLGLLVVFTAACTFAWAINRSVGGTAP